MSRARRGRWLVAALLVPSAYALGALALPQPGAHAHPFGEPQTVRIAADGDEVVVRWRAPADDLRALGGAVGALPERREIVFEPGSDPEPVGGSEAELLLGSAEVAAYLESHIAVRREGVACRPDVRLDGLLDEGARLGFDCGAPVRTVEIEVSLLTDLHPAYRTVAIGVDSDPERRLYTTDEVVHTWRFDPDASNVGAGAADTPEASDTSGANGAPGMTTGQFGGVDARLLEVFDSAIFAPLALLVAALVGAAHGLAPGHGKTIAAAYLVGTNARFGHASALAAVVAGMHTVSVLSLGLLWWALVDSGPVPLDTVTGWGRLLIGLLVLGTGIAITLRAGPGRRTRAPGHRHESDNGTGRPPWSRAGLVAIATTGGLLPSPSAFLVLVSGLLTGRVGLAVAMTIAFGLGLAATVLAAGLLAITGRDWLARKGAGRLPLLGGLAVVLGGCVLSVHAATALL